MLARTCPAAMVVVPGAKDLGRNPREHTEPADLLRGADLLLDVLQVLASQGCGRRPEPRRYAPAL